jgi:hypothetical protein
MTDKNSLDAIDHIAITVKDIKEAVDWYYKHFECFAGWLYLSPFSIWVKS